MQNDKDRLQVEYEVGLSILRLKNNSDFVRVFDNYLFHDLFLSLSKEMLISATNEHTSATHNTVKSIAVLESILDELARNAEYRKQHPYT